jgi:hypothetical protein
MSALVASASSCRQQPSRKLAEEHAIYLNQCLLRDAVEGMSRLWNIQIDLDPEVSSLVDQWIDYAPKKEVTLRDALDDIVRFVEDKHQVRLRWVATEDRIRICKDKSEQGFPPNDR